MAVKTSWSSGDVLTAADLTDTFAAKGDVTGETWTGTHDFTGATVTGAGSLVLVATASPSSQSSVVIDNCFSASYRNYLLLMRLTLSSSVDMRLRYRAASSDSTTGYTYQNLRANGSSVAGSSSPDSYALVTGYGSTVYSVRATIFEPALAASTRYIGDYDSGAPAVGLLSNSHSVTTAYDGVTIYPASGTMTGTIRVYGYQGA